jgi:hypothetical protein
VGATRHVPRNRHVVRFVRQQELRGRSKAIMRNGRTRGDGASARRRCRPSLTRRRLRRRK